MASLFRDPHKGNTFGNDLSRDPPWLTAHGTLSNYHNPEYAGVTNESERMETLIIDSGYPEKYLLPPEFAPCAPILGREWQTTQVSTPTNMMSGLIPDNVDSTRRVSPNQRRRQQLTAVATGLSSTTPASPRGAARPLWRSCKAQRVEQKIVDTDVYLSQPRAYDPNAPPQLKLPIQTEAFGPLPFGRARFENESTARIPRLRANVCPRMAQDPVPEIQAAGVVVVPSHVSTLCGQKRVELTDAEKNKIAEPRLKHFNKSSYMSETLGGVEAPRDVGHSDNRIPTFPIIETEGMEGQWKPWSVCNSSPEWMLNQSGDKSAILRKITRDKREKQPVIFQSARGHVNPWTVSSNGPEWVESHMNKYDSNSVLTQHKQEKEPNRRAEWPMQSSSQIRAVLDHLRG